MGWHELAASRQIFGSFNKIQHRPPYIVPMDLELMEASHA